MRLLLDIQALIWTLTNPSQLTKLAQKSIQEADIVFVSPINFYEIAIKIAVGRAPGISSPVLTIIEEVNQLGFTWLAMSPEHIDAYIRLPFFDHHRDPFDRMILAIALAEDLTIVSSDHNFPLYDEVVKTIW